MKKIEAIVQPHRFDAVKIMVSTAIEEVRIRAGQPTPKRFIFL